MKYKYWKVQLKLNDYQRKHSQHAAWFNFLWIRFFIFNGDPNMPNCIECFRLNPRFLT